MEITVVYKRHRPVYESMQTSTFVHIYSRPITPCPALSRKHLFFLLVRLCACILLFTINSIISIRYLLFKRNPSLFNNNLEYSSEMSSSRASSLCFILIMYNNLSACRYHVKLFIPRARHGPDSTILKKNTRKWRERPQNRGVSGGPQIPMSY